MSRPVCSNSGTLRLCRFNCRSLKNNRFSGPIPPSMGYMSNLAFLDISGNKLRDSIPVSDGTTPGLDMLQNAKHLYVHSS